MNVRRKRSPPKPLPDGLKPGISVKIYSPNNFRTPRLGLVEGWCPKGDGGIYVQVMSDPTSWICMQEERGDKIEVLSGR